MALLHRLKRKYGGSVEEILGFLETAKERLTKLEGRGEEIARLEKALAALREQVVEAGRGLGLIRREAAEKLGAAVTEQLRDLQLYLLTYGPNPTQHAHRSDDARSDASLPTAAPAARRGLFRLAAIVHLGPDRSRFLGS